MKSKAFIALFAALLVFGVSDAFSQDAQQTNPPEETVSESNPVLLAGQALFHLTTEAEGLTLEKRSEEVSKRIQKIAESPRYLVDSIRAIHFESPMTVIVAGEEIVLAVLDEDATSKGKPRQALAAEYAQIIRTAVEKYRRDRSLEQLVSGAVYAVIATVILIAGCILIGRLRRKIEARIDHRFRARKKGVRIQSYEILRAEKIGELLKTGLKATRFIFVAVFTYIYLQLILGFFPVTRPYGEEILHHVLAPLKILVEGFAGQIPNLLFLIILVLLVRYILRFLKIFFQGVEQERVKLPGFYSEWAKSTYRIISFGVIAFFVVIAFPYIPGSDSLAFKGVSVFVGLLFSLGSQSAISNIIAGFALTYRRAFRVGDRVQIADVTGDVLETRLQVTTLRTVKNEEIVVPNSMILNSLVTNYSAMARERGLILHPTLTIGYDTPWRQVHALLLMAARKTSGLQMKPEPFVVQKSLDDFYVTYELNVYTDKPERMAASYSELHQNILDAFNEYGVQIMSPNYESDRLEPAIVPKEHWYAPPAEPPNEVKEPDLALAKS